MPSKRTRPYRGGETFTAQALDDALYHGAVLRVRPKAMTVAVITGLLPILWGTGTGSEVMSRIAAPMIGGMITAPLLSLFIIPAAYKLIWLRRYKSNNRPPPEMAGFYVLRARCKSLRRTIVQGKRAASYRKK